MSPAFIIPHISLIFTLVAGKLSSPSFFVYNCMSNTTTELTPMPAATDAYGMTVFGKSGVLVCGGSVGGHSTSICTMYNITVNTWTTTTFPMLPMAITNFAMITLMSDIGPYFFGGSKLEIVIQHGLHIRHNKQAWVTRAPMQTTLQAHTAVALNSDTALVCGGASTDTETYGLQSKCYTYTMHSCGCATCLLHVFWKSCTGVRCKDGESERLWFESADWSWRVLDVCAIWPSCQEGE